MLLADEQNARKKIVFWWKSESILIVVVFGSGKAVEMSARRGKGRQSILITDFFSPISSLFHQKQKETSVADSDAVDNIWIIPQKVDALKKLTTYLNIFFVSGEFWQFKYPPCGIVKVLVK